MHPNPVIYLDYAATSPVDPRVVAKMNTCLTMDGLFANPSSQHLPGQAARNAVKAARASIATVIHAEPDELIFTSGATESCNLAIKGAAQLYTSRGRHIITMATEHSAVLDSCEALEKNGYSVTRLLPDNNGLLHPEALAEAIRPDTALVSIMQVNNEIGVIQDIPAFAALTAARGILLHVDAAQAIGKIPLDVKKIPVDLVSFCAHKCAGPKGIGALYIRKKPRIRVATQIHGGGHEQGQRSGTLATHQIIGMAEACSLAEAYRETEYRRITALQNTLMENLSSIGCIRNGHPDKTVPHIINLLFPGITAKSLLAHCPELAVSTGSACHGKSSAPSHVLRAMGLSTEEALSAVRISMGRFTTDTDIEQACKILSAAVHAIQR